MIKLENFEVMGWEHAIRGMRNPMNSWEKSDFEWCGLKDGCDNCPFGDSVDNCKLPLSGDCEVAGHVPIIGPNDHELMMKLANAGPVHGKFRRMITVYVDITAPLYWWKEFDTYKVGTVANSCSTMHKIHAKFFTLDDFSVEHLFPEVREAFENTVIKALNECRDLYVGYDGFKDKYGTHEKKDYWWQMIQLLPSSYNQKRTVQLNYEVLANIYQYRKNHKLDEWVEFCKWIESLPYSEIITGAPNVVDEENRFVKVVQEQNAEIEALKKKIEEMEKETYIDDSVHISVNFDAD